MANNYQVTYESTIPGLETQVLSTDLTFQEATRLSAELQAEAFVDDGHDLHDGHYAVQPQAASNPS